MGTNNVEMPLIPFSLVEKHIKIRTYKQRLRKRPANPEIKQLMQIKEENSRRIINIARQVKAPLGLNQICIK